MRLLQLWVYFLMVLVTGCKKESNTLFANQPPDGYTVSRKLVGMYSGSRADNPYLKFVENTNCGMSFFVSSSIAEQRLQIPPKAGALITAVDKNQRDIIQSFMIDDVPFTYINQAVGYKAPNFGTVEGITALSEKMLNLFGKEVLFTSYKSEQTVLSEKIYIPTRLILQDIYSSTGIEPITAGKVFKWNTDVSNHNGVVIRVTATDNNNMQFIENIGFSDDNGSYSLDAELLSNIPTGSNVLVELLRGNLIVTEDTFGTSYKLFAYSLCAHSFVKN